MDDDLTAQLRHLGEAAEATVPAVSADEAHAASGGQRIDVGAVGAGAGSNAGAAYRRRPSARILVAAAAALVIGIVSVGYLVADDGDGPDTLEVANSGQDGSGYAVPDDNGWERLRQCEASGDYTSDTGNTFYGAYQFTRSKWNEAAEAAGVVDLVGANPAAAAPFEQDALANMLYLIDGVEPWPICGRFIEGPMVTPVIPSWVGRPDRVVETRIFLDPDLVSVAEASAAIRGILDAEPGIDTYTFVDKPQAFAEFQARFDDDEAIRMSVVVDDMPTSFRVNGPLRPATVDTLRSIRVVFEVVEQDGRGVLATAPMRLTIDALALATPIHETLAIENLALGVVVMRNDEVDLVLGGHGSVPGSVFERLDELQVGDRITITSLVEDSPPPIEITRTFVVTEEPETLDVGEAPLLASSVRKTTLTLVADVAGDAQRRTVVRAELADPDPSGYALPDS